MQLLSIESQYKAALSDLINYGERKPLYNHELGGEDPNNYTMSLVGRTFHHKMTDGFPLYTSKYVYWKGAIAEMLWFLKGGGDLQKLRDMNVHIWDQWGYRNWLKAGNQGSLEDYLKDFVDNPRPDLLNLHYTNITNWAGSGLNQTEWVLDQMTKKPYVRNYVVNYIDPTTTYHMADEVGNKSVDIVACHYQHHLLCSSYNWLTLTVSLRSQDMFLGNPFNLAQYGALLEMYALCLSNRTGESWNARQLVLNCTGDYHIYSNQNAAINEQLKRLQFRTDEDLRKDLPKLSILNRGQVSLTDFELEDFKVSNYNHQGRLTADVYVAGGYN